MILHSQIIGEGIPFVILHGFLGMSDNWKTLGKKFAEMGYQVHLVDQRNHGRSFHSNDFNYQLLAQDLKEYCDHHTIEKMILLGHSMGGKTAMEFACLFSEMVSQLIIADIGPKAYPQQHQDILKALATLDFNSIKTRGEADEILTTYIKDTGTRQFLLKNLYWEEKGKLGLRINLKALTSNISEVGKPLVQKMMYKGDALFVKGGRSHYIETIDEMGISMQFPNAKFAAVDNVGHWLHAENPKRFLEIIANFLQKDT